MLHMPAMRMFILRPEGVRCEADGLFVGAVPLLRRARDSHGREHWSPRPAAELDNELTARYGLPIDVTTKSGGMATVARALDRGDLALAGIAAALLQFPDPPPLEKRRAGGRRLGAVGCGTCMQRPPQGRLGPSPASAHRPKAEPGVVRGSRTCGCGGVSADAGMALAGIR